MSKKIVVISGDPNSINSEIIFKSWNKLNSKTRNKIYLISNFKLIKLQLAKLKKKIGVVKVSSIDDNNRSNKLKIIDMPLKFVNPFNVSITDSKKFISKCFDLAHDLSIKKRIKGFINCPISKKLIKSNKNFGVTEYLAKKCNIRDNSEVMLIFNKKLAVSPITTHIDIKDVAKKINSKLIVKKIKTINAQYKYLFGKAPKIGVLGLNPHNAEFKKDSEEKKIILPAIKILKKRKIKISNMLIADTAFINEYKKYNVIVGMYHDQVLAPFKTLFKFDAINITLGLSYLRLSPDHGPAQNLVGKNKSECLSLFRCIKFLDNLR